MHYYLLFFPLTELLATVFVDLLFFEEAEVLEEALEEACFFTAIHDYLLSMRMKLYSLYPWLLGDVNYFQSLFILIYTTNQLEFDTTFKQFMLIAIYFQSASQLVPYDWPLKTHWSG